MAKHFAFLVLVLLLLPLNLGAQDIPLVNGQSTVERLDISRPDGEFSIGEVNGQSTLKLSGVVRTLRIRKIDGQSSVDAKCLVAHEVIIDELNGQSDLLIKTANFTFRLIDGQSVVLLSQTSRGTLVGTDKIDGQSRILWSGSESPQVQIRTIAGNSRVKRVCF